MPITEIDPGSVRLICSGQGIPDLATGVKELLENAIDAGATRVEVKLKENGLTSFEVVDNGLGIDAEDFEKVCKKHFTSKINEFHDIESVKSYGFRGEALSSLCELSGKLTITTRMSSEKFGTKLEFASDGTLKKKSPVARPVGTTVTVEKLFAPLIVRRKEFERNIKKQYARLLLVIQSYAIVSSKVQVLCTDFAASRRSQVLSTPGGQSMKENLVSVFGSKFLQLLVPINWKVVVGSSERVATQASFAGASQDSDSKADDVESETTALITGYVSKIGKGIGRSTNDRQFWFMNRRPVDLPKATKAINEVWRQFEMKQKPAFMINIEIVTGGVDVNVTPDKRQVMINHDVQLYLKMKELLLEIWEPSKNVLPARTLDDMIGAKELESNDATVVEVKSVTSQHDRRDRARITPKENGGGQSSQDSSLKAGIVSPTSSGASVLSQMSSDQPLLVKHIQDGPIKALLMGNTSDSDVNESSQASGVAEQHSSQDSSELLESTFQEPESPGEIVRDVQSSVSLAPLVSKRVKRISQKAKAILQDEVDLPDQLPPTQLAKMKAQGGETQGLSHKRVQKVHESTEPPASPAKKLRSLEGDVLSVEQSQADLSSHHVIDVGDEESSTASSCAVTSIGLVRRKEKNSCEGHQMAPARKTKRTTSIDFADVEPPRKSTTKQIDSSSSSDRNTSRREDVVSQSNNAGEFREHSNSTMHLGSIQNVRNLFQKRMASTKTEKGIGQTISPQSTFSCSVDAELADESKAELELERHFMKTDFDQAEILGQFNLGFIIARVRNDLFILDQHACDEKYRFETLQRSTTIHEQKLIRPLPIELGAMEQQVVQEHMDIFEENGFRFLNAPVPQANSSNLAGEAQLETASEACRHQLLLTSIPHSFKTQFGEPDVHELASVLRRAPPPPPGLRPESYVVPRIPRMRAMFASRSCRSAVMIGTHLRVKEMDRIVKNMSGLDQPWNCPHGRPTMRHLVDLTELNQRHTGSDANKEFSREGLYVRYAMFA